MAEVSLLLESKYDRPIKVMALIDTGASSTILNPDVLPEEYWIPHVQWFTAADGNDFCTKIISRPIRIQIFPNLSLQHQFLGSHKPGKDLVIGWDLLSQLFQRRLQLMPDGVKYKSYFQASKKPLFGIIFARHKGKIGLGMFSNLPCRVH